ncbi:MAG: diguanylate cyclase [Kineosporiaceae bacterium]
MGIRTRVATVIAAASLAPLVGAVAVTAWWLPRSAAEEGRATARVVAATAAADLTDACTTAGERAALLATRLQLAAALALLDGADPGDAVAAEAPAAVAAVAGSDPAGGVAAVGPDTVLASAGELGVRAAAVEQAVPCATGAGAGAGEQAAAAPAGLVLQAVPVRVGPDVVATAVAARSAEEVLDEAITAAGSRGAVALALVDPRAADPADAVTAATGPGIASPERAADLSAAARDAAATAGRPGGADEVVTTPAAGRVLAARAVPGGGVVVAVADLPSPGAAWPLAGLLVLVAAALAGAVALATVTVTRGVTRLADVTRRLSARSSGPLGTAPAGDLVADLRDLAGAPEPEVRSVTATIDDLLRLAQESQAGAVRATASVVDAFGRFGAALDRSPEQEGLLRSVAEAALLAADARLAVVSFTATAGGDRETAAPAAAGERTVAVFLAGGAAWSRQDGTPVLLTGEPDGIDLTDPDDLAAATTGLRLLRDLAAHAVATGRAVSAELPGEGSGVVAPLRMPTGPDGPGGAAGYVAVARDAGAPALEPAALGQLSTLARHAGAALLNVRRHHLAARQSITDPLTGIGNLRLLTQTLGREVERAARFGHSLSVLMLDLDHFKAVNDTHGHARGDQVLAELARRLARCVRDIDTVARYGGEEFCLVLPETSPDGAEIVARRVLAAVSGAPFPVPGGPSLHVTVSIGVAAFPEHGRTGGEVMRAADRALYAAKRTGRDKVVVADPAGTRPPATPAASGPAVPSQTPRNQGVVLTAGEHPIHLG